MNPQRMPRPLRVILPDAPDELVRLFLDPVRSRAAYWKLLSAGSRALPALGRGLDEPEPEIRLNCVKVLDHLADDSCIPLLAAALRDEDARVRREALHALACEDCKEHDCAITADGVLAPAIELLLWDPHDGVRAAATAVVGRFVHASPDAAAALAAARDRDKNPTVRKIASWHVRGGPIHERTRPRSRRRAGAVPAVRPLPSVS